LKIAFAPLRKQYGRHSFAGCIKGGKRRGTDPVRTYRRRERTEYYASWRGSSFFAYHAVHWDAAVATSTVKSIGELMQAIVSGGFEIMTKTFPLSEVEHVWDAANSIPRTVFQMP
jgi:hypothetical protein